MIVLAPRSFNLGAKDPYQPGANTPLRVGCEQFVPVCAIK